MNILPITQPMPSREAADGEALRLLSPGQFAEVYAATEADACAAEGLALAAVSAFAPRLPILWIRHGFIGQETGRPYAGGLREMGIDPARFIIVHARNPLAALQAGLEGARCPGAAAVVIGLWGETKAYDLVASRRLALAAAENSVALMLVRIVAAPSPSAAAFRWSVASAASEAFPANAPGHPVFEVKLLRARTGAANARYRVEWNRDARTLTAEPLAGDAVGTRENFRDRPALSGAVVPLSAHRPVPPGERLDHPRAG
jgi:protein ImuA